MESNVIGILTYIVFQLNLLHLKNFNLIKYLNKIIYGIRINYSTL